MSELTKRPGLVRVLRRHPSLSLAIIASLLAALYWGVIASDRYISEAHVIIQTTDMVSSQSVDLGSLLGAGNTGNQADQMLLRDYLLSVDMLKL
ncbi:MAG: hypothetical protein ACXWT3_14215, partial [Methylococcaceae bacterium]